MQDPTRSAAFDLLTAVLEKHRSLEDALDALPAMEARDRAAGHRLAASVLRRAASLDLVIEPFLKRAPPEPVRHLLRMGAAQALLLDTPAHAAVSTMVDLGRARGLAPFAGLVNAVLRRVAEGGAALLEGIDGPRTDTPAWLWASWGRDARAIAVGHQTEAPLDLSLKPGVAPPEGAILLPNGTARMPAGTRVTELPGFEAGDFWVQDAAASLPARLLNVHPGERVADLCAAPGGKTAQLVAAGGIVTAVERDGHRAKRLAENLARLRLEAEIVVADAERWEPADRFDAILLDAPCSATGTIRRHPDIPWLKRQKDVTTLAGLQDRLLFAAIRMLKPDGRLVFATCSLQPEEGVGHQLRTGLRPDPLRAEELPGLEDAITLDGQLRTHPGMWAELGGMDGFFAARYLKLA